MLNAHYRGFINLLLPANADLPYLYYIDSFNEIANFTDSDIWFDYNLPYNAELDDCVHMPADNYDRFYGQFLSSWFTHYSAPNVTIMNTSISNTDIN